jgi:hypothetical protein
VIYPNFSHPFTVACDASTKAVGTILSLVEDGAERSVAYGSRQLNSSESKYSITGFELLALILQLNNSDVIYMGDKLRYIRVTELKIVREFTGSEFQIDSLVRKIS